jgi:arsenate reductase
MAEGFAREAGWHAYSAGTKPEMEINPNAVKVMVESGIDISKQTPQPVDEYIDNNFTIVATVCDNARESCPHFTGNFDQKIHKPFKDPALVKGSKENILMAFRNIRDEIKSWIDSLD